MSAAPNPNSARQRILAALCDPQSARDLATTLDLAPKLVSRTVRHLQVDGLVVFDSMTDDGRRRFVRADMARVRAEGDASVEMLVAMQVVAARNGSLHVKGAQQELAA